jgi:hypothetical protein
LTGQNTPIEYADCVSHFVGLWITWKWTSILNYYFILC